MPCITDLALANLGPVTSYRLRVPTGADTVIIAGPSESGKTTLINALSLLLTGASPTGGAFPVELIFDGADRASVAVQLADNCVLRATLTPSRARTWTVMGPPQVAGDPQSRVTTTIQSQEAWQAMLGLDPVIVRAILVPDQVWRLGEAQRGRPLRDLLLSVLPEVSERDIVRRYVPDLRDEEPVVEASSGRGKTRTLGAADRTTEARRAAAVATGALTAREADVAAHRGQPPAPPTQIQPAALEALALRADQGRAWIARYEAHQVYQRALVEHRSELERIDAAHAAVVSWEARRAQLGDRPAHPGDCPSGAAEAQAAMDARAAERLAQEALDDTRRGEPWTDAEGAVIERSNRHGERLAQLRQVDVGHCAACLQEVRADVLAAQIAAAEAADPELRAAADQVIADATARREALRAERRDALRAAQAVTKAAEAALDAVRATQRDHAQALQAVAAHDRAVAALGAAPPTPGAVPLAPAEVQPPLHRTTITDALASARAAIAAHDQAVSAAAGAEAAHAAAVAAYEARGLALTRAAADAQGAAAGAAQELQRAELILDVVRRAPTEAAAASLDVLRRELSQGVGVRFGTLADGAPEAQAWIDGRPWWCASTGRQIAADLVLRQAIRRLAAARYPGGALSYADVPVVVDAVSLWTGQLQASAGGQVWLLETAEQPSVGLG